MSLFTRLALLFVVVPVLELALLVKVGQWIGILPTVALVLGTGVAGAFLARLEGLRTFVAFQRELLTGGLPQQSLMDAIGVLVGGILLLTPGILTDLLGFSLLFPPTRRWFQRRIRDAVMRRIADGTLQAHIVQVVPLPHDEARSETE